MKKIKLTIDPIQSQSHINYLMCPHCKQKLADLHYFEGNITIRFKCRRCGTYVVGTEEEDDFVRD